MRTNLQKELVIAGVLIGFAVLVLPLGVFWVGQGLIGQYAPGAGMLDLAESIWWELMQLRIGAWILVLSPYLIVQIARLTRFAWRQAPL